ncbi:ROK family protein [Sphaerochaeta sp. PS]|uniref:ROK family protein n=1 Tax=Sphaerochaeta sp. PS TaxID=3076336 RepID=UPI0028A55329|nr:ROK family protein [Sphaerochaeta sp. PS]MDT4761567.1 ROK family protein [Sphaerochaeta sp. PS]
MRKGPKANLMKLNPEFGRVVGIEMLSSLYRIYLSDITGSPLFKAEFPYRSHLVSGDRARFEDLVVEVLAMAKEKSGSVPLLGVCIAVPGIVMEGNTTIDECWTHGLYTENFAQFLTKFPFPVIFENDANCCAVKYLFNNDDSYDSYFYLLSRMHRQEVVPDEIPTIGLGLGVVIRGKLFRGTFSRSGEYRSSLLMGTDSNGQIPLTKAQMLNLDSNVEIQKECIRNLLSDLFCTMSIFDPSSLYIGGFLASSPYRETLTEVFKTELTDSWIRNKWNGELILVHETVFDPAEGAADVVLDLLFRVPQVGHSLPENLNWNALLNGII